MGRKARRRRREGRRGEGTPAPLGHGANGLLLCQTPPRAGPGLAFTASLAFTSMAVAAAAKASAPSAAAAAATSVTSVATAADSSPESFLLQ